MIEINYFERRQDSAYHQAVQVQPFHVITIMNAHLSALLVYKFGTQSWGGTLTYMCFYFVFNTFFQKLISCPLAQSGGHGRLI